MSTTRSSFYYDPVRQGYDTALWKTLSGTVVSDVFLIPDIDSSDVDFDLVFDAIAITESVTITNTDIPMNAVSDALSIAENVAAAVS